MATSRPDPSVAERARTIAAPAAPAGPAAKSAGVGVGRTGARRFRCWSAAPLVGEGGFEPPTSCSQSRCATAALLPGCVSSLPLASVCGAARGGGRGRQSLAAVAAPVDSLPRMNTVVEPLEGNKVKLSIEVDAQEFERSIDAAFRKIAREVRVPGFRPGKAPRRILEARLGAGTGRAEALRDSLPEYYARALRDNEVDAIAPPEIDITAGEESGPVTFDAVVEVRPQLDIVGYGGLRVTVPSPEVTEEDITAQVDRLRGNFGRLEPVDRPARAGDNVTIDLKATRDGEPVGGLTTDDFLYELGSGTVLPELDEQLEGAKIGDILAFDAAFGGPAVSEDDSPVDTVQIQVLVKNVNEKILPDVTDEWASEASEFDTVHELRADFVKRMTMVKRLQASMAMRNGVVEALVALVDVDAPEPLVNAEIERRANDLGQRLAQQNATVAQYLEATGQSEEQVVAELRAGAEPAVKADLALRAVAESEGLSATDEEVDAEISRLAESYSMSAAELRRNLDRADQLPALRSDVKKTKALEWLVENVELVDPEGHPVDRSLLTPEALMEAEQEATAEADDPDAAESDRAEHESGDEADTVSASSESGEA
jgi:trigger factor